MRAKEILTNVAHITGNALPYNVVNGHVQQLPDQFSFLNTTNDHTLTSEMMALGAIQGQPYDLIYTEDIESVKAANLTAHGKVYTRFPAHRLKEVVSAAQRSGLYWCESLQRGDFVEVIFRPRRRLIAPVWDGKSRGVVLLHSDWGWGDCIKYLRYAQPVQKLCGSVLLEVRCGMESLASTCGVEVITKGQRLPFIDYHIEICDLDKMLGIPPFTPYLKATKIHLGDHYKIGLVWAGNHTTFTEYRFYNPELAKTLRTNKTRLYSLQKDMFGGKHELPHCILDMSDHLGDWAATASLVNQMDLIVTIDTSVAHLAGALGKNVVLVLPKEPYHSQLLEKTYLWYPTMHIMKGDWRSLFRDLKASLII
jgi:hypothetical protein